MLLMLTPELSRWCKKWIWSLIEHRDTQPHWSLTKAFPLQGYVSITEDTATAQSCAAASLPSPERVTPKPTLGCGSGQRGRINPSETLPELGFLRQPEEYTLLPVHPVYMCQGPISKNTYSINHLHGIYPLWHWCFPINQRQGLILD